MSVLGQPESTEIGEYELRSHIYRALVLTYEQLAINTAIPKRGRTNAVKDRFIRLIGKTLHNWEKEHPNDSYFDREYSRLVVKFPEIK